MKTEYFEIMRAEIKANVYGGKNCDEHVKLWNAYAEGDMQDDDFTEDIKLCLNQFPIGTKLSIQVPMCPDCGVIQEMCDCGFNWKHWIECQYS